MINSMKTIPIIAALAVRSEPAIRNLFGLKKK